MNFRWLRRRGGSEQIFLCPVSSGRQGGSAVQQAVAVVGSLRGPLLRRRVSPQGNRVGRRFVLRKADLRSSATESSGRPPETRPGHSLSYHRNPKYRGRCVWEIANCHAIQAGFACFQAGRQLNRTASNRRRTHTVCRASPRGPGGTGISDSVQSVMPWRVRLSERPGFTTPLEARDACRRP